MDNKLTSNDAQRALGEIATTMAEARNYAALAASPILYVWGIVWVLAYGLCQFFPEKSGFIWMPLCVIGGVLTGVFSQRAPVRSSSDGRVGIACGMLCIFAGVWFAVLMPWRKMGGFDYLEMQRNLGAYGATLVMFAYVMMGLWWDHFFMWLGLTITGLTLVGFFAIPEFFNLWMAIFGGGLLLLSGWLIKRRWKSCDSLA